MYSSIISWVKMRRWGAAGSLGVNAAAMYMELCSNHSLSPSFDNLHVSPCSSSPCAILSNRAQGPNILKKKNPEMGPPSPTGTHCM